MLFFCLAYFVCLRRGGGVLRTYWIFKEQLNALHTWFRKKFLGRSFYVLPQIQEVFKNFINTHIFWRQCCEINTIKKSIPGSHQENSKSAQGQVRATPFLFLLPFMLFLRNEPSRWDRNSFISKQNLLRSYCFKQFKWVPLKGKRKK